ncbi:MAG: hypothetical protein EAX96_03155 [Candidatus Lokiarchaeota archaeon]|nr:hypothetical protein [Candidatus Lokiarchaeota archaeon]
MKKQKSLFDIVEPKSKKKKKEIKNLAKDKENILNDDLKIAEINKGIKLEKEIKIIPKIEMYTCNCGLKIHWKIAEARKQCPQCNQKIDPNEIFDFVPE